MLWWLAVRPPGFWKTFGWVGNEAGIFHRHYHSQGDRPQLFTWWLGGQRGGQHAQCSEALSLPHIRFEHP